MAKYSIRLWPLMLVLVLILLIQFFLFSYFRAEPLVVVDSKVFNYQLLDRNVGSNEWRQYMELTELSPLFFVTDKNYKSAPYQDTEKKSLIPFETFGVKMDFSGVTEEIDETEIGHEELYKYITNHDYWDFLTSFGKDFLDHEGITLVSPICEIENAETGESMEVPLTLLDSKGIYPSILEFYCLTDKFRNTLPLLKTKCTGSDAIDDEVQALLERKVLLRQKEEGYSVVRVHP